MSEDPLETASTRWDDDLEHADLDAAFSFAQFDFYRLFDRRVLQIAGGIAIASAVAVWPARTDRVLARLIGIALIVFFASDVWARLRRRPFEWSRAALGLALIVGGAALLVVPDQSIVTIGRLLALALIVATCRDLVLLLRRSRLPERRWAWPLAKGVAGLATALLIAVYPSELLGITTGLLALGAAALGAVALVQSLNVEDERTWRYAESRDLVISWLDDRPKQAGARRELYEKILFEGPELKTRVARFTTLMTFAGIIASMGVITDSTAVVIGAMLVAPLMTPLMGTAISVVMGWPNRLTRSASIVVFGVLLAIGIGIVLGLLAPTAIDPGSNSQIVARSSPTILDLITAIAAGGAGAYGLSRPDVSDALPGVAIAISLVPPLSVVGIAYSQGAWAAGNGALLLFVTNALAIIIVGGMTFVLTGVTPIRRVAGNQQRVRTASASIVALGALVVGALGINGGQIAANALEVDSVEQTSIDWVEEFPRFDFVQARIDGDRVTVVIIGPSSGAPPAPELQNRLVKELGREVTADVRLVVQERDTHPPDPSD